MNVASGATAPDGGTIVFDGSPVDDLTPGDRAGARNRDRPPAPRAAPRHDGGREHPRRGRAGAPAAPGSATTAKAMRSLLDDVHFIGPSRGPRLVAQRRPATPARARQGVRRIAAAADPRRADRAALAGLRRAPVQLQSAGSPRTGRRSSTSRTGWRGSRDRRPRHRPARRQGCAAPSAVERHLGRRAARADHRAHARGDLPAESPRSRADEEPLLRVEGLSGHGFDDISFAARKGEIVGHRRRRRQRPDRRSCARSPGARRRADRSTSAASELSRRALLENAAYMPADRLTEGLMVDLNVRENAALTALDRLTVGPFVSRRREVDAVERELSEPRRQGTVARGAGLGALGRQPAEGRDGARDALPAGHPRRRRADAGRRRRRARRDLPHPPRGRRPAACRSSSPRATRWSSRGCATA